MLSGWQAVYLVEFPPPPDLVATGEDFEYTLASALFVTICAFDQLKPHRTTDDDHNDWLKPAGWLQRKVMRLPER